MKLLWVLERAAIDGAIAAAQPEYIKRENVWALSTAFGDAYLIQVSSAILFNQSSSKSFH